MPKVDVSTAITINLCTFGCIDLVGSMLMCVAGCIYMYLHACMQGACPCDALLWFSSQHFYSFYSYQTIKFVLVGLIFLCLCVSVHEHAHMCACLNCDAFLMYSSINFFLLFAVRF